MALLGGVTVGFSTGFGTGYITNQAWVDALAKPVERFMPDKVQFLDPKSHTIILDNCPARIQPIRSAVATPNGVNDTQQQAVLVSIPIALGRSLDLRPVHRMAVTVCDKMPILRNYLFVLAETMDAGSAVERTFVMTVDLEVKVTP